MSISVQFLFSFWSVSADTFPELVQEASFGLWQSEGSFENVYHCLHKCFLSKQVSRCGEFLNHSKHDPNHIRTPPLSKFADYHTTYPQILWICLQICGYFARLQKTPERKLNYDFSSKWIAHVKLWKLSDKSRFNFLITVHLCHKVNLIELSLLESRHLSHDEWSSRWLVVGDNCSSNAKKS